MKKILLAILVLVIISFGGYFGNQYYHKKKEERRVKGLNTPLIKVVKEMIQDEEESYQKYKDSTGEYHTEIMNDIMKRLRQDQAELDTLEHWDDYPNKWK